MEIQNGKLKNLTKEEIRNLLEEEFLSNCENIDSVKKGGILDYIFNLSAETELHLQNLIGYIAEIANPESSEGKLQDSLYERIGVKRLPARKGRFSARVRGVPGKNISHNSILLADSTTKCEFINNGDFTFNQDGIANVIFDSVEYNEDTVTEESEFIIVRAPKTVTSVDNSTVTDIFAGQNRESDDDYRIRFRNSKALNSKATHKANLANLGKYLDNPALLNIIDKNSENSMNPYFVKIVAKPNTTDEVFAQAILDTFGAGIIFQGNTSVLLKDTLNNDITVKYQKAEVIPIFLKIKILSKSGFSEESLFDGIKSAITNYFQKQGFGLGATVYATEFIIPTLEVEGVEAVSNISVKRDSEENYTDIVNLAYNEVPQINESQITTEGAA